MTPQEKAEQVTKEVLLTQPHTKQLVLDSPPGAGKTGVVERLAIQGAWIHDEKVMIATQTNGQSFDLALRLARGWKNYQVHLFTRRGLPTPEQLDRDNITIIHSLNQLPEGPVVVVANAAKWSYSNSEDAVFDLMLVDEAYQLRDAQFAQISGFARRHVLVGDPGQIAPVVTVPTLRWQHMKDGPHVPAPQALLARRPQSTKRMMLPASRRLPRDSVEFIQPLFYSQLPFQAVSDEHQRKLLCEKGHSSPASHWDPAIDQACSGASIVLGEMPTRITGEFDSELADQIVLLVRRLVERKSRVDDDGKKEELSLEEVGVVCAHRSQVYAVQERLASEGYPQVLVETADRYQGLEKKVMIVHHPLSGRMSLGDFQMDMGRFCVMLSRHRIACFVVARAGIKERLAQLSPTVSRVLNQESSPEHQGRWTHKNLLEYLESNSRIYPLGDEINQESTPKLDILPMAKARGFQLTS